MIGLGFSTSLLRQTVRIRLVVSPQFGCWPPLSTTYPVCHPEICNSNKTKLSFAGTGSAKQVSADLPLLQHVAPKTQRPKYRFVARNAATRRFFCKNKLSFADCPKELEELFCRSCKNKLRFVAGCKNSLVFADKSQGGVGGKVRPYNAGSCCIDM